MLATEPVCVTVKVGDVMFETSPPASLISAPEWERRYPDPVERSVPLPPVIETVEPGAVRLAVSNASQEPAAPLVIVKGRVAPPA